MHTMIRKKNTLIVEKSIKPMPNVEIAVLIILVHKEIY